MKHDENVLQLMERPRLGTEEYNRVKSQAQQDNLQTYDGGVFYYEGEEKLRIFYHQENPNP